MTGPILRKPHPAPPLVAMLIIVIMACMIVTFFFVFNHSNFSNSRIETKDSYTVFFIAMIIVTFFFVFNLFTSFI